MTREEEKELLARRYLWTALTELTKSLTDLVEAVTEEFDAERKR